MTEPICLSCKRPMTFESDVALHFFHGTLYRAKQYKCRDCQARVATDFSKEFDMSPETLKAIKEVEGANYVEMYEPVKAP